MARGLGARRDDTDLAAHQRIRRVGRVDADDPAAVGPTNLPAAFFTFADCMPLAARVASVTNEDSVYPIVPLLSAT